MVSAASDRSFQRDHFLRDRNAEDHGRRCFAAAFYFLRVARHISPRALRGSVVVGRDRSPIFGRKRS